jgi:hypothetical protein
MPVLVSAPRPLAAAHTEARLSTNAWRQTADLQLDHLYLEFSMKLAHSLSFALAISTVGAPAWAVDADEHQAHHPAGAASAPASRAMAGKPRPDMARMDSQMMAMHEMHDKMMAAKSPAERDALTAEHMRIMQESMNMMNGMSPGGMSGMKGDMVTRHQTMEARMEMMQATMQMMMDRLPAAPTK